MVGHEVADSDGANLAVREEHLQCLVRLHGEIERRGKRLVKDEKVDLLDAELRRALVERVQGGVVAVVADPDFVSTNISTRSTSDRRIPSATSRSFA
jgi:hypothetical protein